ncbi:MAG: putative rane protein [Bryobacterales bacterium]|nr:putative rane protein [Bryobacterales bacterium]
MNDRGQVAGTFYGPAGPQGPPLGRPIANFLYTPGVGVTNIERTGPPSVENFEGSAVAAINSSGQVLLASGVLYGPDRPPQDLGGAVRAAYPDEPEVRFVSLNDSGTVSGIAVRQSPQPGSYTAHVFRYAPGSSAGVITVAMTNNRREFPQGPYVMDDAGNVIISFGSPPGRAKITTAAGVTVETGCSRDGNGWATAVNNSGQIGGGWGRGGTFPEICTLDPNTLLGRITALVDETLFFPPDGSLPRADPNSSGFVAGLNNKGDAVGWKGGFNSCANPVPLLACGIATLFTGGQIVDVNSLFPSGSGWVAKTADRINDAGEIAGTGTVDGVPAVFVLSPAPSPTYSVQPLCSACTGTLLSNSGFAVSREASPPFGALVSSPRGPDIEITNAPYIQQINDIGTIVGSDSSGHAFIANAPYNQVLNLNSVFGWSRGTATGINDGNDVIGQGDSPSHGPLFPNLQISNLLQINNAGQVTGSYLDAGNRDHFLLYTPGIGLAELPDQPVALSNTGHVLAWSILGTSVEYSLVTSNGILPLPAGFTWRALNDRDEIVGDCNNRIPLIDEPLKTNCAAYYSPDRGLIRLSVPGLDLASAVAINNAGRILANASSLGSSAPAAVLLIPGSELAQPPRDRSTAETGAATSGATQQSAEPFVRSLNGVAANPALDAALP